MKVRKATIHDLPWITTELNKFCDSLPFKMRLNGDTEAWDNGLRWVIESHVFLVSCDGDKLTGLIAGVLNPHPFNNNIRALGEIFWWVAEDSRHSRAGLMLLNEFVAIGKERADWVTMSAEANSALSSRAFTSRGFQAHEKSYLLEVA